MPSSKQVPNNRNNNHEPLEARTLRFALSVRDFVRHVPRSLIAIEDGKQLVRSSGSVGANYIEANESLSKRDFAMRAKICRKEAKESRYWLQLFDTIPETLTQQRNKLIEEPTELVKIFSSMVSKL